jgi:hypothetical protein
MLTAQAAVNAGRLQEAIPIYRQDLAHVTRNSFTLRAGLMSVYIRLNRWDDLETERLAARKASLAGDPTLSIKDGYVIDTLHTPAGDATVTEYSLLKAPFNTRDHFLLVDRKDPCTGFTPYIDLESDDANQPALDASHPDRKATGDRAYSLVAYTAPGSQWYVSSAPHGSEEYPSQATYSGPPQAWIVHSYPDAEPTYQTLRSDVLSILAKPLLPNPASCPKPNPETDDLP